MAKDAKIVFQSIPLQVAPITCEGKGLKLS